MKFIFIILIVFAIFKFYPSFNFNPADTQKNATQEIRTEKTIFKVNQSRDEQNKAVQDVLDNQ